jgi:hypothetical protein
MVLGSCARRRGFSEISSVIPEFSVSVDRQGGVPGFWNGSTPTRPGLRAVAGVERLGVIVFEGSEMIYGLIVAIGLFCAGILMRDHILPPL